MKSIFTIVATLQPTAAAITSKVDLSALDEGVFRILFFRLYRFNQREDT